MTQNPARRTGPLIARVIFTANRDLIFSELDAGWSVHAIYDRNFDRLKGISYRQLTRYVALARAKVPSPAPPNEGQANDKRAWHGEQDVSQARVDRLIGKRK